jgi:hypothetical protein
LLLAVQAARHKLLMALMVLLELLVVILRLGRTYPLLAVNLATVVQMELLLAVLVLVLWVLQANHFHELAQMPLYMVNLVVVMLAPPEKVVTLLVLVAVLVAAVLLFRLVTLEVVLTKEVRVAALVEALMVELVTLVALAVQILGQLVVVERLARQMEEPVARVLSVKVVVVAVRVFPPLPLVALVVWGVLAAVEAVAVEHLQRVPIQALAVMAVRACAVSTLGKELT